MIRRGLALLVAAGLAVTVAACPGGGKSAVPTDVEIDWPDAGMTNQAGEPAPVEPAPADEP